MALDLFCLARRELFLFLFGRSFRLVCQQEDTMVFILPMQLVVRVVDSRRYIWLLPDGTLQFLVWESNLIHLANHHYVLDYIRRKSYIYN